MRKFHYLALVAVLFFGSSFVADVPLKVTWQTLSDVTFNKSWNKTEGMFILIPQFGDKVKPLKSKQIEITGYMIPIDIDNDYYVLSANPFASCFFCGGAGPESVMTVKFKKVTRRFDTDERLTLRGTLILNSDNLDELNYILTNAEVIK